MVLVAVFGLLAAITIPNFVRARGTSPNPEQIAANSNALYIIKERRRLQKETCLANLEIIGLTKDLLAIRQNLTNGATLSAATISELKLDLRTCPAGGRYKINAVGQPPRCSCVWHSQPPEIANQ